MRQGSTQPGAAGSVSAPSAPRPSGTAPTRSRAGGSPPAGAWTGSEDEGPRLLEQVARGDHQALAALFDRYAPSAFGLAVRVCNNRSLAEDVLQEAFVSIWQRAGRFNPEIGSVTTYLLAIVHNKAVDAVRHEEVRRRLEAREEAAALRPEPSADEVSDATWLRILRCQVRSAIASLSVPQREALELAYFAGLSHREVAETLGIPLGTAKSRLRDGLIRLRSSLSHLREDRPECQ